MPEFDIISASTILDRIDWLELVWPRLRACTPRILIVTDGSLNYMEGDGFGLTRFIQAITDHAAVTLRPALTLAHRGSSPSPVSVYGTSRNVVSSFNFSTANPAVTTANYDQVWMFGIQSSPSLSNAEIAVLADFMNGGGGVFSTGDHATLGAAMGSRLPRIRHMRDWASIPMGGEALPGVRNRIDTVVNPGSNNLYEFADQSDQIPQRIYPNYTVTGTNPGWTARIHPVLRMPGSPLDRRGPGDLTNDMDVMPDHPHESVCREVSSSNNSAAHSGTYNDAGRTFQEFPHIFGSTRQRVPGEIAAFAVSGGRAIDRGDILKPPVNPRMFGIIGTFDGHLGAPYANNVKPGRIVVDSTWHHFVNINLDGIGSGRNGLGTGSGAAFVPSADLLKIYTYYRNIVSWLQPANRVLCPIFRDFIIVSFSELVFEEAISLPVPPRPSDLLGIGSLALAELERRSGKDAGRELVIAALGTHERGQKLASMLAIGEGNAVENKFDSAAAMAVGQAVLHIVALSPERDAATFAKALGRDHEKAELALRDQIVEGLQIGFAQVQKRAEGQAKTLRRLTASLH